MNRYKLLSIVILISILFSSCNMNKGGVKVSNNMEKYALEYIESNQLLNKGENIMAYYDYTISLDGTEAVILTDERLIYHNQETTNTSIYLKNITAIKHRKESLIGDIIEVYSDDGSMFMIEIASLNNGETFLKVLQSKVLKIKNTANTK